MIVTLRRIEKNRGNARLILKWENAIRRDKPEASNQLTTHVIKWSEHWQWFLNKNTPFYYFVCAGKARRKIGTVSMDFEKNISAFVSSILIAKPWRNKGIGARALEIAVQKVKAKKPRARIIAKVFSGNLSSLRCFLNAGFNCIGNEIFRKKRLVIFRYK